MHPPPRTRKLIVLCDGTWCGRETNTYSNIQFLASMIGVQFPKSLPASAPGDIYELTRENVKAAYLEGVGLGKSFQEYLFDGATASTIADECVQVYEYIVQHYVEDTEIWLFGLSRGAFTVRCVAGMINNCGIVKRLDSVAETSLLCKQVYQVYRSPYKYDEPHSAQSESFRANASWQVKQPIRFMGLFDTIGGLGIPRLNSGVGFEWPELHDQVVSSEVQHVYHAVSLHDRLWIFQPCLAFTQDDTCTTIHEKWFPGTHYDLGRQNFRFLRSSSNLVEKLISRIPDQLSAPVEPNQVLSDVVLEWMLTSIRKHDHTRSIIADIDTHLQACTGRITSGTSSIGSGDIYANVIPHLPGGHVWESISWLSNRTFKFLNGVLPMYKLGAGIEEVFGIKQLLKIVLETKDRRISKVDANVLDYRTAEPGRYGGRSVAELADMDREEGGYASRTYEAFLMWLWAQRQLTREKYTLLMG